MIGFIEVASVTNNCHKWINVNNIKSFEPFVGRQGPVTVGSNICYLSGGTEHVRETCTELIERIKTCKFGQ